MKRLGENLLASQPDLASFTHEERKSPDLLAKGERRICSLTKDGQCREIRLAERIGGMIFEFDPASFFQVNNSSAELLGSIAKKLDRSSGPMLDIYCGVGAPGQLLAAGHDSCLGIEIDKMSVRFAAENAETGGLKNCRYLAGDAGKMLESMATQIRHPTCALLDPPRAGMDRKALSSLMRIAPEQIIYLACNPPTMGRDARILAEAYQLRALYSVDMFPHTPHLECAGLWEIKPR